MFMGQKNQCLFADSMKKVVVAALIVWCYRKDISSKVCREK